MTIQVKCPNCLSHVDIKLLLLTNSTYQCSKCDGHMKIEVSRWRPPASQPPQPSREALAKVAA